MRSGDIGRRRLLGGRQLVVLFFVPEIVHQLYHVADWLLGWRGPTVLWWLPWSRLDGIGWTAHVGSSVLLWIGIVLIYHRPIRVVQVVQDDPQTQDSDEGESEA